MGDLRANTDVMRSGAGTISTNADTLAGVANRISSLNSHLGGAYQGQLRDKVGPILSQAVSEGIRLQSQSGQFSANLNSIAGQIDGVMQQGGMAISGGPATTISSSYLGAFFSRVGQLAMGVAATVLSWIGFRKAVPVTKIPPNPTPAPLQQQPIPAPTTFTDTQAQERKARGEVLVKQFDGKTYAQGTYNSTDSYSARPVAPPVENKKEERDSNIYNAALNQFGVETNPRYKPRNNNTYCNIYVWDATRAMNAEIPHWVDANGNPMDVGKGRELNANGVVAWLRNHGNDHGWHAVSAEEAQSHANKGAPAVVVWANPNPGQSGHVAMVRPGEYSVDKGPNIAQAGANNYNHTSVSQTFGDRKVTYYVHD
jgi:hypothetical protein